jgi:hypothetical protein
MDRNTAEEQPDPNQGYPARFDDWPSTPYLDVMIRAQEPPMETSCVIGLFGDCTVAGMGSLGSHHHLALRLRRAFPGQPCLVRNLAANGESARTFLDRIDAVFATLPRLDIAFIRYGINDRKQDGIAGCIHYLGVLCEAIERQYPGVAVIIETSVWVDYPAHYLWDRNAHLGPLYDAIRIFAHARGLQIVDIYRHMEEETRRGNWDLRIRGVSEDVYDDSLDEFFGDDPAFFTNIHPNGRCRGLIAGWEVEKISELFGERLPNAHPAGLPKE